MNALETKLSRMGDKTHQKGTDLVEDAKLLLDVNASEERQLLKSIGLDNDLRYIEAKQTDTIIRSNRKDQYGKQIVHIDEIKRLCLNYRLYFRRAKNFTGVIPADLAPELVRFTKEKDIAVGNHSDYSDFYVIAPPRMFLGYKSPSRVVKDALDYAQEQAAERQRLKNLDPILLYKVEEDYYAIIRSWGSDFSPKRRLYGMLTSKVGVKRLHFLFTCLISVFIFSIGHKLASMAYSKLYVNSENGAAPLASIVIHVLPTVAVLLWIFNETFNDFRKSIRRAIPTESNWKNF